MIRTIHTLFASGSLPIMGGDNMWCWIDKLVYKIPWKHREKIANKTAIVIILCMLFAPVRHFVTSIIEAIYYRLLAIYYTRKAEKENKRE